VDRIKVAAFVITGSLAGIAGLVLAARINSGQPNLGQGLELQAIAAAVVGGMALTGGKGTMGGVALGVLVLAILQNGLDITNVSSYAQQVISGIVILVAIVVDRLRGRSRLVAADLESDELAPES
jgi:ribose/xylose/arabinose/galactoside ABC-type transport system permease subunit